MDLQIGFFCIIIATLSSLIIYIILSVSSIKEDSFEEAKANRRKFIKQYQDQSKTAVVKGKEKKVKKTVKPSKKSEVEDDNSSTKENEEGEATNAKELIKLVSKTSEEVKSAKEVENKKAAKAIKKPPLTDTLNDNASSVIPPGNNQGKTISKPNSEKLPQSKSTKKKIEDNPGKRRPEEDVSGSSHGTATTTSTSTTITATVPEEPIKETKAPVQEVAPKAASKPSKKKRSEITNLYQLNNEKEAVSINLLLSLVQKAELSRTEIQLLIDALLNKQQEDISEWLKGRQDPQVKLQKHLVEMELALKDEKQISAGFQAKLKELRNEINTDKANARHTEELLATVQSDCKALSLKLQQSIEENQILTTKVQQFQKQLSEEQLTVHKLRDELNVQQQITEKKCHEAVVNLQAQVNQYVSQLQELQATNSSLRSEISIFQENDLRIQEEYREVNGNLERALTAATFDANTLRNELNKVERSLAETQAEAENLKEMMSGLKTENQSIVEQNKQYLEQCSLVAKENELLKQKESENIENGFSYDKKRDSIEYEARLEESCKVQQTLLSEIEVKNKTIEELSSSLHSLKNDYQNMKMNSGATNQESKSTVKKQVEQDDTVLQLKKLLNDRNAELEILKQELETSKQRNNELRSKNWKVVEALTNAEKKILSEKKSNDTLNDDIGRTRDLTVRSSIERIVKHLYPEISLQPSKASSIEEWLLEAEQAVTSHGQDVSTSSGLQSENSQLHSLVQHYKTIITETEGMLNQLQNHVEVEESRWKEKLLTLEEELELLKQNQCK